jgi:hypothetical protein
MNIVDKRASSVGQAAEELVALDYVRYKIYQAEEQGIEFDESQLDTQEYIKFALDRAQGGDMFTLDRGANN